MYPVRTRRLHTSHDVVLLCLTCHETAGRTLSGFIKRVMQEFSVAPPPTVTVDAVKSHVRKVRPPALSSVLHQLANSLSDGVTLT